MYSNAQIFLSIAEDALLQSQNFSKINRRPNPDGEGEIITLDLEQSSFKQALIAITFAGAFFEAITYIELSKVLTGSKLKNADRARYNERLKILGICNEAILNSSERLRVARINVMHEKASNALEKQPILFAQKEAQFAVEYVKSMAELFSFVDR